MSSHSNKLKRRKDSTLPNEILIHYTASRNNAIVSVTDQKGQVIQKTSIGSQKADGVSGKDTKFKNSKKRTPKAAESLGYTLGEQLKSNFTGFASARLIIKGFILNGNYNPFVNALKQSLGGNLISFDYIELPLITAFNGPRLRKKRRA